MTTEDVIIELFCRVDDTMYGVPKHSQVKLYPSEVVTLALLFALKGGGSRAVYRGLVRDFRPLFPNLPERTRLFRLFYSHRELTEQFTAERSMMGVFDTFSIELIRPWCEGQSARQIGKKGKSNSRWIIGSKLALLLNNLGLVVGWDYDTANGYDGSAFRGLVHSVTDRMIVFTDEAMAKKEWRPSNLKVCKRCEWNTRMLVETVLSMLTTVCHFKKITHRVWTYFESRLAYTMALFYILVQWHGLDPVEDGHVRLAIAEFSL